MAASPIILFIVAGLGSQALPMAVFAALTGLAFGAGM
ncbi:hypothetical protein SAMN05444287_1730 [Octadecabacter temperatus]|uniref:Uncharacterized protein n=1 Tax=Octadecabacter temperatus TaxID=1458307 RepID=A0A0K0Y6L2_9RHOB|nr:hypothetical protein OSB_20740 [Octadecabacter temperatus]SIO17763.1 hypothetical protein SAMN05444287_1730 [Octadecabacter temperatus]